MSSPDNRPVVVVLCTPGQPPPSQLANLEPRVRLVSAEADGLAAVLPGAKALLLWDFFSGALRSAWTGAHALDWIHVAAAGVDTLLFDELVRSQVVVTNARGIFDRPIAEFVLGAILAQAKRSPESLDLQRDRVWQHRETALVAGANVLVVGTGGIGRETVRLLRAVGANVRGAGRTARDGDPDFGDVLASDRLAEYVGWADHVVLATPLTPQTHHLIDDAVLAAMRPTAHLVNVGRGAVVDESALLDSLRTGSIGAVSLDVFDTEPLPPDSPWWSAPNVVVTPHLSGDAAGWRDRLADQFVANAVRWLDGAPLENVVDKELGYVPSKPPEGAPP